MIKMLLALRLFCLMFIFTISLGAICAQGTYQPMLEITRFRWINGWFDDNLVKELNFSHDTVVGTYPVKVYTFTHEWWFQNDQRYYYREDNNQKKVWQVYPGNDTIPYDEYLLYDFSLEVGDTISFYSSAPNVFQLKYLHHIDTIELLDGPHRRLVVYRREQGSSFPPFNGDFPEFDWIEGVGNLFMPLYPDTKGWDNFDTICAWRGDVPVVGPCSQAEINCAALSIDSLGIIAPGYMQLVLDYGTADWAIYVPKIYILNTAGDTLAQTNYSGGAIQPGESAWQYMEGPASVTTLPPVVRVIVYDTYTGQSCDYTVATNSLFETPGYEPLEIFPNPATQLINLRFNLPESGPMQWQLVNTLGQITLSGQLQGQADLNEVTLYFPSVASGHYYLRLHSSRGQWLGKVVLR